MVPFPYEMGKNKKVLNFKKLKMATTHKYSCLILLHVLIYYQNILTVNFTRSQKVVPAGWLVSADGLEISLHWFAFYTKQE